MIGRFLTGEYEVKRSGQGFYKDGTYHHGPAETIKIRGSMQPHSPREAKMPSEGARLKQYWFFYTDAPLVPIGTKNLERADVIEVNGETYKVMSQEIWQDVGIPYYKSIIYREPENV